MNEELLEKLIKTTECEMISPDGLKERIMAGLPMNARMGKSPHMTPFEKFIFVSPLRTACLFSSFIVGILWAVMGSGFTTLFNAIFSVR